MIYRARRKWSAFIGISYVILALVFAWAVRHIITYLGLRGNGSSFIIIYGFSFFFVAAQVALFSRDKAYQTTMWQNDHLKRLHLIVNVPVCNEDPQALRECILSMMRQTRRIDIIHVVVNGPNKVDYTSLKQQMLRTADRHGFRLYWDEQSIAGKRHAQASTIRKYVKPDDIFLTVDSDAYLDMRAVEEGLKPLAKPEVMSVAGIVLNSNNRSTLLTRMSDLWFLTQQLVDRASFSVMGSVLVNSGVLAFYRGHVVIDNLDSYLDETFFGHPVQFSDDSMLTMYALQKGKTVQQSTSFCFTLMPEKFSHHFRQQIRWMRGSFIRSWWRFKYLPIKSFAYWGHFIKWCETVVATGMFIYFFAAEPVLDHRVFPFILLIPLVIGYAQGLQYLTVERADETFWYRLRTYLMLPLPALWAYFVLRFLRYYAIATCFKTGWGTRQNVEVSIAK